jgi:hypothetical protein
MFIAAKEGLMTTKTNTTQTVASERAVKQAKLAKLLDEIFSVSDAHVLGDRARKVSR